MLNRQFMVRVMAQFPRPNMNQQPAPVTLQDFAHLNPTIYRSSTQPLDADDSLCDITFELESADVAPANYVILRLTTLKVPLLNCGASTGIPHLLEPPSLGQNSKLHSAGQCRTILVSHNVPVEIEGLKTHTASIICATKTVYLLHPSSEIVSYMFILFEMPKHGFIS